MDKSVVARVQQLAKQYGPRIVEWRRHIHMQPEASMQEHDTAAYVVEQLRALGVTDIQEGVGETGVVALIRGKGKKTVGLRADMDALELTERNAVPYRSRRRGMMHACGHDGHTAGLLGVAAILMQLRQKLPGNVKLLFQPGEEGAGGAAKMIRDGVLENPKLVAIASLHVAMDFESAKIGIGSGWFTAQVDDIYLAITGKTGHAARPDMAVDAIGITSQVLIALQQFVGRHTNPLDRRVISIGMINGGTRHNIVADSVNLVGTVRTLEPETRERIMTFLNRDLRKLVSAMGGGMKLRVEHGYPPSYNEERVTEIIKTAGADIVGARNVMPRTRPGLGGEDFAYFGEAGLPAAMLELGIKDEKKGFTAPGHSSRFDFDDKRVLPIGAAVLTEVAWRMLETF